MTPNQRRTKAKRAFDAYEIAYGAAMEFLREDRDNDRAERRMGWLVATHELFRDMRHEADFTALIIHEAEQDAERG